MKSRLYQELKNLVDTLVKVLIASLWKIIRIQIMAGFFYQSICLITGIKQSKRIFFKKKHNFQINILSEKYLKYILALRKLLAEKFLLQGQI